jgi:transposase
MKSHEVLRDVFETCSPKEVAAEMGLSVSLVYKWAEPPTEQGSGALNPLDRVEALIRCTNDQRIVQWLCERAGGFFVQNPSPGKPRTYAVVPATNKIVQEFADMLSVIASAALDNSVTKEEAEKIRARWEELKSVTEGFVKCCEHGDFQLIMGDIRERK